MPVNVPMVKVEPATRVIAIGVDMARKPNTAIFPTERETARDRYARPAWQRAEPPAQGAFVLPEGVRYRTWSEHPDAELIIYTPSGDIARTLRLVREDNGFWSGMDEAGRAGDLYKYRFGDLGPWPDPASRFQPGGVHGPSMVVDKDDFAWTDTNWKAPSRDDLIIYELHVGTFTPAGNFSGVAEKLAYLADLGVTAIELMPIADFPGQRNWGYDGVAIYAPARVYGQPNDLRKLVDRAHEAGIAVILDVVYNHFGPDGNYLPAYHRDYFHPTHKTPWGAAFNFEQTTVRDFFRENVNYWMDEFHIDGFRLDATHSIEDGSEIHILSEIATAVQDRGGVVIAEDERNDVRLLRNVDDGGFGIDACWADDFHHVVHVMLTGENDAYYKNYRGTAEELAITLENGWLFTGQVQQTTGKPRGTDPSQLEPSQFVLCLSNHDQVGNRAFGERLNHLVPGPAYRAAVALLCLSPYTPLLFMGQEWGASTPFQYFTDHHDELGAKIVIGRRREFCDFAAFRDPGSTGKIPDPQAFRTFIRSRLLWSEATAPGNRNLLRLHRECLRLRRTTAAMQGRRRSGYEVRRLPNGVIAIVYRGDNGDRAFVVADLLGTGLTGDDLRAACLKDSPTWTNVFSSNDESFSESAPKGDLLPETAVFITS